MKNDEKIWGQTRVMYKAFLYETLCKKTITVKADGWSLAYYSKAPVN